MTIHINADREPGGDDTLRVSDNAVAQLFLHGWEPPAGNAYNVEYDDHGRTEHLFIPIRQRQATAPPTHAEIALTIAARIHARLKLTGTTAEEVIEAHGKGIQDAAEAIQDLYGSTR